MMSEAGKEYTRRRLAIEAMPMGKDRINAVWNLMDGELLEDWASSSDGQSEMDAIDTIIDSELLTSSESIYRIYLWGCEMELTVTVSTANGTVLDRFTVIHSRTTTTTTTGTETVGSHAGDERTIDRLIALLQAGGKL